MQILKSKEMSLLDKEAIETVGIPGTVLMENASRGVCEVINSLSDVYSVVICCGLGNNGGDGLATARNLFNLGYSVEVVVFGNPEKFKGDAKLNYDIVSKMNIPLFVVENEDDLSILPILLGKADVVVDALFGTGLSRPIEGFYEKVLKEIRRFAKFIVSIDIPSGIFASSSEIPDIHIKANITVTFDSLKYAHVFPPACKECGEIYVVDISIPKTTYLKAPRRYVLTPEVVTYTLPERSPEKHKYDFGHLAVVGGSPGKTGAVCLAAEASLRAGVGLSTVFIPSSLNSVVEEKLTEAMSIPVEDDGSGEFLPEVAGTLAERINSGKFSAVAFGMGLGWNEKTAEFTKHFLRALRKPVLIDADGLNCISDEPEILTELQVPVIITPHVGEFSRLSSLAKSEIIADLPDRALDFARRFNTITVLKSGRTVIASPEGDVFVNLRGNPGMATAGTGDVLSGVIGAFLAMRLLPSTAAQLGVFLHSLAADIAINYVGEDSLKAGDIVDYMPDALLWLRNYEKNPPKREKTFVTSLEELKGKLPS